MVPIASSTKASEVQKAVRLLAVSNIPFEVHLTRGKYFLYSSAPMVARRMLLASGLVKVNPTGIPYRKVETPQGILWGCRVGKDWAVVHRWPDGRLEARYFDGKRQLDKFLDFQVKVNPKGSRTNNSSSPLGKPVTDKDRLDPFKDVSELSREENWKLGYIV